MKDMEEMRIKADAPLFARPTSLERKYMLSLADIPEASPGPNAFAQRAARMEKHRLDGNAFYQQEVERRKATPPTAMHPALRPRSNSDPPTPPRDSSCTTMSPFVNAGGDWQPQSGSPPLKLVPSNADMAMPTQRGYLEERRELIDYRRNGSGEERTPVFIPTPKTTSIEFADPAVTPKKRADKESTPSDVPSKTPKRGFLGRLKLTTNLRGNASPATTTLSSSTESGPDENMPVKAQAVLGATPSKGRASLGSSPSKTNLPRSPSKRKGFFSRKSSGLTDGGEPSVPVARFSADIDRPPQSASTATTTPQTAISDPTHYSYQNRSIFSQSNSDKGTEKPKECAVIRSQSLKYFDSSIPPTPPAKNTPPEGKAKKEAALANQCHRVPFHDDQTPPAKEPVGIISTNGRISPTRFGSYGHREMPMLVTKPSMYSLHASVVPDMTELGTFEEMKARIDGLGLEGFSMPPENVRSSTLKVYSPSIYPSEWVTRPNTVLIGGCNPPPVMKGRNSHSPSAHTKESSSSGGEIPICYPELDKDPSVSNITNLPGINIIPGSRSQSCDHFDAKVPWHGQTHSHDHSGTHRLSVDSALFARHIDHDLNETYYDSPTSFNHPSAAPSPLQLAATTYTPPPRQSSKLQSRNVRDGDFGQSVDNAATGLGIHNRGHSVSSSPSRQNDVFDNAPCLMARPGKSRSRSPSPEHNLKISDFEPKPDVDPQKPSPKKSPSTNKLDQMIEILNKLQARNNEIGSIRDEMRATNSRLDQRLAVVEQSRGSSPSPSPSSDSDGGSNAPSGPACLERKRVATNVAHDFYRRGETEQFRTGLNAFQSESTESESIAELKETNKRLLELVGGFAEKIQALEKKVGGQE